MPTGGDLLSSSKDLIQAAIQEKHKRSALERLAKQTQAAELQALLELDTSRYDI